MWSILVVAITYIVVLNAHDLHDPNADCSDDFKKKINVVLGTATAFLNNHWNSTIMGLDLDPFMGIVKKLEYPIDHKDGCTEICGAQLASCHHFSLKLTDADLYGLSKVVWHPFTLSQCALSPVGKCPYGKPTPGLVSTGVDGLLQASAKINLDAKLDIVSDGGGIRVTCKDAFKKWTELLWKGKGHCNVSSASVTTNIQFCAGMCNITASKDVAAISSLSISKLSFNLDKTNCKFDGGQGIPHLIDIIQFFDKHFFDDIIKAMQKPLQDAINKIIGQAIGSAGIPEKCNPKNKSHYKMQH